jgi:hypothetical protein
MSVRKLVLSSALVALMGFVAIGCNENPSDPINTGSVTGLKASSMSATSVALSWTAVTGATSYDVKWVPVSSATASSGSTSATGTSATATSLQANTEYTFTVTARDASGTIGTGSSIVWAGATRHTSTLTTQYIRMFEKDSDQPSGLNLNVAGSPMLVHLAVSSTDPKAQLAMYVYHRAGQTNPDSIIVGPVYALVEYRVANDPNLTRVDSSVYISATTTQVASLNDWYLSAPLNTMIAANSNVMAYVFKPTTAGGTIAGGQGFVVRTGTAPSNYHYARVVIRPVGGQMLGGTKPNRYVDLEISYQDGVNVPYAKPGQRPLPIGVYAQRMGN